tara:strand:+ start:90 stop:1157 length:1068 start_codon:yes stop_codon:yes gene_type:complete
MGCIHDLPPHVLELSEKYGYFGVDDGFVVEDAIFLQDKPHVNRIQTKKPLSPSTWKLLDRELFSRRPDIWLRVYGHASDLQFLDYMENLESFSVDTLYKPVESLQSISSLSRLRALSFHADDICNFDFLDGLGNRLTSLSIGKTKSKKPKLDFLSGFIRLEDLNIHGHSNGIEVISNLKELKHLSLSGMSINDFDFLSPFDALHSLSIDLIKCPDYSALRNISIKHLSIAEIRNLQDLGFISGIKGIQNLSLSYLNKVTALPPLESHATIRRVGISDMRKLSDISSLFECERLTDFYFTNDNTPLEPEDFKPLLSMKNLKYVRVGTGRTGKNKKIDEILLPSEFMPYEYYEFEYH